MSGTTAPTPAQALVTAMSILAEALRTAAIDPADQVRLLSALVTYAPPSVNAAAPIGQTIAAVTIETANMAAWVAAVSLALACAAYQPTSYDDAVQLMASVSAILETLIETAADGFHDNTYAALRALRTAVIQDLTTRGANLPTLMTVTTPQPVAALPLAYRLYADSSRADDVIARAEPINPLFLPTSMRLLSS
jgi:prophage DNA circulation protein